MRTTQLEGNLGDTSTGTTEILDENCTAEEGVENSKIVYLNDSYELDEMPLDVETIIDLDDNEESY